MKRRLKIGEYKENGRTIDIIQLKCTYKNQPRDNKGKYIHVDTTPEHREKRNEKTHFSHHYGNSPILYPTYPITIWSGVNLTTSIDFVPSRRHGHLRIQTLSPRLEQSSMASQKICSTYDLVPGNGR